MQVTETITTTTCDKCSWSDRNTDGFTEVTFEVTSLFAVDSYTVHLCAICFPRITLVQAAIDSARANGVEF